MHKLCDESEVCEFCNFESFIRMMQCLVALTFFSIASFSPLFFSSCFLTSLLFQTIFYFTLAHLFKTHVCWERGIVNFAILIIYAMYTIFALMFHISLACLFLSFSKKKVWIIFWMSHAGDKLSLFQLLADKDQVNRGQATYPQWCNRWGAGCPPETSDREIFADVSGKKRQGKGVKIEK